MVAVAGVHPVEEEGVNGGSAGGAFAWREAESSGKTRRWFSRALSERLKTGAVGLFSSGYGRTQPYPEIRAGILLLLTVDDMATLLAIRMAILHATAGNCIRISEHRITRVS